MKREDVAVLKEVFGVVSEAPTSIALLTPSNADRSAFLRAVRAIPINIVLNDIAVTMGMKLADQLEAMGLRPADFADLLGTGEAALEKLRQTLRDKENQDVFTKAFVATVKGRG